MPSPSCNRLIILSVSSRRRFQHFVHAIPAAYIGYEIAGLQAALLHVVPYCFNRVRQIEGIVLSFPGLHQRHQHIEPIALGRIASGIH